MTQLRLSNSNIKHPRAGETKQSLHYGSGKEMHFVTRGEDTDLPHCTEAMVLFNFGSKNILKVCFFLMTQFLRIKVSECGTSFLIAEGFPYVLGICYSLITTSHRPT